MSGVSESAVEAAARAIFEAIFFEAHKASEDDYQMVKAFYERAAHAALEAAVPAIRADIAAEVLAPIEALIETDGVFLKKDTKIKRVQEDRRRDLGAIVTTSMVTVDDIRAALSTAKEASE